MLTKYSHYNPDRIGMFKIVPTDNRFSCYPKFTWAVMMDGPGHFQQFFHLVNFARGQLGPTCLYPLKKYGCKPCSFRLGLRYRPGYRHRNNDQLYFKTREDLDLIMSLFALSGNTEL